MSDSGVTRRVFLHVAAGAALAATASVGCPRPVNRNLVEVFKRSGRGKHVSQAAKKHNANKLYRTRAAAQADSPHPGDKSKVVSIFITKARFDQLFGANQQIVDLRHV